VVQVAFASGAVEGKIAMAPVDAGGQGVDPLALAMLRMTCAALFFQVFMRTDQDRPRVTAADHKKLAVLSLLGIVINQALFLVGLKLTTAFSAALLSVTIPVFTAVLAAILGYDRAKPRTFMGLGLAALGVLVLTGVGHIDVGVLVVTVNCLSYSLYVIFSRDLVRRLGAITVVAWVFTWAMLTFAPIGAYSLVKNLHDWGPRAWVYVAYIVALPTIVAYALNAWALGRSNATMVTVYVYLQPILAALIAWVQLGQRIRPRMIGATLLIFAGVGLVLARPLSSKSNLASR
jgi:drug/metabolite transporter (DMT)-like permease